MKNNKTLYTQWLENRRQVSVPENFANGVIVKIERRNRALQWEWSRIFKQPAFHHPLARWGTGLALVLLGLFRIFYVATGILRTHPLMP